MGRAVLRRKVLFVEDEPSIRSTYARCFEASYEMALAASGLEALQRLQEPLITVLDLGHSGYLVKPFHMDDLAAHIDAAG